MERNGREGGHGITKLEWNKELGRGPFFAKPPGRASLAEPAKWSTVVHAKSGICAKVEKRV